MIAATDPQEFIPGGRQQASRHPGPLEPFGFSEGAVTDHFLLHRLEKVSLTENKEAEWWVVRKTPVIVDDNAADKQKKNLYDKSQPSFETNKSDIYHSDGRTCEEGKNEPGKGKSAKNEANKYEPGKNEANRFEPDRYQSGKYETSKYETAKYETAKYETARSETSQHDGRKSDSFSMKSVDLSSKNKRLSDTAFSKFSQNKRFSHDNELLLRNDSRSSSNNSNHRSSPNKPFARDTCRNERLRCSDDIDYMEEELYVKGSVVVWSKGLVYDSEENTSSRTTVCLYSSQFPVKQALWCTFYCELPTFYSNTSELLGRLDEPVGNALPSICVLDTQRIRVFVKDSEDFSCSPPFMVKKLWATKFGILLEKENQQQHKDVKGLENTATVYSLGHPLDEVRPVAMNPDSLQLVDDQNLQIVYTSENPSICMTYDSSTGQHSVHKIRRVKQDVWMEQSQKMANSTNTMFSSINKMTSRNSMYECHRSMSQAYMSPFSSRGTSATSIISGNGGSGTTAATGIPSGIGMSSGIALTSGIAMTSGIGMTSNASLGNTMNNAGVPGFGPSGNTMPGFATSNVISSAMTNAAGFPNTTTSAGPSRSQSSMATISRCQSPAMSPLIGAGTPWFLRSSRLQTSLRHLEANISLPAESTQFNTSFAAFSQLSPHLCFSHLWTDCQSSTDGTVNSPASKVFLCDDLTGQWYLCYLVPSKSQLSIAKVDMTNAASPVFGMLSTSISALDAVAIPNLHMIAILEHSGNVVLYSGLMVVGKLHIGGVLAQHVPSPCLRRQVAKQFVPPFLRRSSLLPHCGTPSADPRFDEHLLSPVLPAARKPGALNHPGNMLQMPGNMLHLPGNAFPWQTGGAQGDGETDRRPIYNKALLGDPKSYLNGLRDAVGDRLVLQYSDGTYYRTQLPKLASSPVVESCLNAFRQTLPRDALITFLTRWYSTRNAPGPMDLTNEKEWEMFTNLIFDLMGYEEDDSAEAPTDHSMTPCSKRQRQTSSSSDSDWHQVMFSESHRHIWYDLACALNFRSRFPDPDCQNVLYPYDPLPKNHPPYPPAVDLNKRSACQVNASAILFPFVRIIHFTLHLLYEELKLNIYQSSELSYLATFLSKLSMDLRLPQYHLHYWKDFPDICGYINENNKSPISENDLKNITMWPVMSDTPDSVLNYILKLLKEQEVMAYPYVKNLNERSKDIVQLCGMYIKGTIAPHKDFAIESLIRSITPLGQSVLAASTPKYKTVLCDQQPIAQKVVVHIAELGITTREMDTYPVAIKLLLHDALFQCRENPPTDWSAEAYKLLGRNDLASQVEEVEKDKIENSLNLAAQSGSVHEFVPTIKQAENEQEDGMDDIESPLLKLRFADDLRVSEVRKLLQSAKPVPIVLVQRPDVSDHDFIEEQEKHLYAVCTRTMALPVGRGMFTMRTLNPVITEPLVTPTLCLTGKAPPRGTTVELTHIDTPQNMNMWPLFHNGVANGLRITPEASNINSNWITFNKPKNVAESPMEHSGFLMGLGLNGHLKNLTIHNTYDYLVKFNEMTSVGVLLGLSAAFRGSANANITKMISLHVEALLPPTSMELDIPQNLQVAALLSIGLLYQNTAHRHMTEVLLTEIGRPPGPEMENSIDRESYSLAAGLALGLVTLRHGGRPSGMSDLNVPDSLHYYMVGGNKRPLTGSQKDKYKLPSFQIREGSCVNLDVTAPGATLALGLMYLGSGNKAVADWMAPPETQYLLDFVRPDFLMLRTLSRALILWNEIEPEKDWVEKQVPATIRPYCMVKPTNSMDIDYEAMNQAYCNIIAGACFALGLKFAGSADEGAFNTLLEFCHMFTSLTAKSIAELAGKPTIETCLNVVLLSISMVMAGTGNLEIMRIVRHLRRRVGVASSSIVTYGSHLAIHMALGLLFLGGGRYTLSNSPASVAALICAFYPKFPTHSNDNRYHLQAFRHLYVLAVEARLVIPKDVLLGRMCYATLNIVKLDGTSFKVMAPAQVPDLNTLYKVSVEDERYWTVTFERGRNWDLLLKILKSQGCIDVKQRVGYLSYLEDKTGYRIELAHTITKSVPWDPPARAIKLFSSDTTIRQYTHQFLIPYLEGTYSETETKLNQTVTRVSYDAVIQDKTFMIPIFNSFVRVVRNLKSAPSPINLQQFKLACEISKVFNSTQLIPSEAILALKLEAVQVLNSWNVYGVVNGFLDGIIDCSRRTFKGQNEFVDDYVGAEPVEKSLCDALLMRQMALYVTFFDIPFDIKVKGDNYLELMCKLQDLDISEEALCYILKIRGAY